MNTFKKRIIAAAALTCIAFTSVGCSSKNSSSNGNTIPDNVIEYETNEQGFQVKAPLQVITPNDKGQISMAPGVDVNAPDMTEEAPKQPVTAYEVVIGSDNQPVTEIVKVTEADGQPVTDDNGDEQTTAVTVTQVVTVTEATTEDEYISNTQSRFIYWLDISKDQNFNFEGQFIKLIFKVKDDAISRDYPIAITSDIATIAGQSLNNNTKRLDGVVRVGGSIDAHDVSSETGLTVYADKISANPGDTIDYYLNIKNNPGVAAVIMWVSFDANALEFTGYESVGEFAEVAGRVSGGASSKK